MYRLVYIYMYVVYMYLPCIILMMCTYMCTCTVNECLHNFTVHVLDVYNKNYKI